MRTTAFRMKNNLSSTYTFYQNYLYKSMTYTDTRVFADIRYTTYMRPSPVEDIDK